MFKEIFLFELQYRIKRPATWAYFAILFLFGILIGIFADTPGSEKVFANSPQAIATMMLTISLFGTMISSAVMGVPIYRDIEHQVRHYYFTFPISEKGYLMGRYLGSLLILFLIGFGFHFGLMAGFTVGPYLGYAEPDRFGPFSLWYYIQPTLTLFWPNFILTGTLFFALVVFTRKVFAAYVGGILFFILYLVSLTLTADLEMKNLVDLLDPYGFSTFTNATQYNTPVEQNTETVALTGNLLWNRLIWLGVSAFLLLVTLFRFSFSDFFEGNRKKSEKETGKEKSTVTKSFGRLKRVTPVFSNGIYFRQMFSLAGLEFRNIIRDPYFLAMLIGGVFFLFLDGWFGGTTYGTASYPTTFLMLEAKTGTYVVFVFIILIFYTGEAVHRDRSVKYNQIADALPIPNWVVYGSKVLALVGVAFLLANIPILSGVLNQSIQGYFNYEFWMYFSDLYLIEFPVYLQLMMIAFFIHVLVNKKFLGHVVSIAFWVLMLGARNLGEYDYNLFFYSYLPNYRISDMNGFGHFWEPLLTFNLYWLALGFILLIIGNLLWNRGTGSSWSGRLKIARQRLTKAPLLGLLVMGAVWIGSGAFIYENVSVLNPYQSSEDQEKEQAAFEKSYSKYANIAQPKWTDLKVDIDIFPQDRRVEARGQFVMTNKTNEVIDSLHFNLGSPIYHTSIRSFTLDGKKPEMIHENKKSKYFIYSFPDGPMQPGDTLHMDITMDAGYQGFTNSGFNREIIENGTFFNMGIFPAMGYDANGEMTSDSDRKKYDLPPKDYSLPPVDDSTGLSKFMFSDDGDWVTFEATLSTDLDQIAVAPGYLQREWEENDRRYFHYKMDKVMLAFFNISSARYEVHKETWTGPENSKVAIEIFHHPGHEINIDRYVLGVKKSLDYFSKNFSPYQFRQMRILEFPRYASFAQSFPNTVPYSEDFGWIGNFSNPNDIDYAFTVTSHEVAHQWWGHQVSPSATRGANQISESMAQYASLMVMKEEYGADAMKGYLKYELDRYLRGRANENKFEKTLLDNDNQSYVWYRKGAMVLYALQDLVGEDSLNVGFKKFVEETAFKEAPFPNTEQWYKHIQAVTPDSFQYFLEDNFEKICLYENKTKTATSKKMDDGRYEVTLELESKKIYYDGLGTVLEEGDQANMIEVGVFKKDGENAQGMTTKSPLVLKKMWLKPGNHTLTFIVDEEPIRAGIDPYNKLIDRIPDDNLIFVE